GDPVQPGKEQRVALEAVQRLVGVQEGILDHVQSVVGIFYQAINRIVQPILVAPHQLAERRTVAVETPGNQALVVGVHDRRSLVGRGPRKEGSRIRYSSCHGRAGLSKRLARPRLESEGEVKCRGRPMPRCAVPPTRSPAGATLEPVAPVDSREWMR